MRNIPIATVPNQELSVTLNGNRWVLTLKVGTNSMIADVVLNDQPIVLGQLITVGTPIIPYEYLQGSGNFLLLVENDELPDWQKFNSTQQLVFVEPGEIA